MIIKETFFAVKCDKCGQISTDHNNMQYWNEAFFTEDIAEELGWSKKDDEHFCPQCTGNEDDLSELIN